MTKADFDSIKRRFGARVRELRKRKGFSQETLALVCELDRTYIGGVERGERNISLVNIYRIAIALGVNVIGDLKFQTKAKAAYRLQSR